MLKERVVKGALSIGRISSSNICEIRLQDDASGETFAIARMKVADFATAMFGLSGIPIEIKVRHLSRVGCTRERKDGSIVVSDATIKKFEATLKKLDASGRRSNRDVLERYLIANCQEDGWILRPELNSQGSVEYLGKKVRLNFSYVRFVKPTVKKKKVAVK